MPAWIHDRAMKLKKEMEKTYSPEKAKQVAFAVATQQAHATGKSPKTIVSKETGERERFGTTEGRAEARIKMDKPKSEYKKTASFESHIPTGERLKSALKETLKDKKLRLAMAIAAPVTALTAGGITYAKHRSKKKTASVNQDILRRTGESNMIDIAVVNGFVDELEKIAQAPAAPAAPVIPSDVAKTRMGGTAVHFVPKDSRAVSTGISGALGKGREALSKLWRSGVGGKAAIIGVPLGLAAAGGIGGAIAARRRNQGQNVTVVR